MRTAATNNLGKQWLRTRRIFSYHLSSNCLVPKLNAAKMAYKLQKRGKKKRGLGRTFDPGGQRIHRKETKNPANDHLLDPSRLTSRGTIATKNVLYKNEKKARGERRDQLRSPRICQVEGDIRKEFLWTVGKRKD